MINKYLIKELQEIIEDNLDPSMFPYKKRNSIRIGSIALRESKTGFLVYNIETKKHIAYTFSKTAAIALAKIYSKGKNARQKVLELDAVIEKNYIDSLFYKHTIETTKDFDKKDITQSRYEIAKNKTSAAKRRLDSIIFS